MSTTAIVGTNDGNVQYGFGLGLGAANTATWVNVTGNGYKTAEAVQGKLTEPVRLSRSFRDFETWWERSGVAAAPAASYQLPV